MKTCKVALAVLVAAVGCLRFDIAEAADFVFTVPVAIKNLRAEITGVIAYCFVGAGPVSSYSDPNVVGAGPSGPVAADASGNLTAKAVAVFDAKPGKDPATATHYRCNLLLNSDKGASGAPIENYTGSDASARARAVKPGTPFTGHVLGTLPQ